MTDRYWRKIENVENDIENAMQISSILLKLKEYDNNLGKIDTIGGNISSNSEQISKNTGNISSNLSKLNNIENNLILVDDIYNETFPISRFSVTYKDNRIFYRQLYLNFTTNGIIKINAKYNYIYDENYTLKHVYRFFNNRIQFKKIELDHDRSSNVINDKFEIQGIDFNRIDIAVYYENNTDSKKIELVGINTIQINYIEKNSKLDMNKNNISSNKGLIETNASDISDNSGLINTNTFNISSNKGLIETNTSSISSNSRQISTNTSSIASNLSKINNITNNMILKNLYTFIPFYDHDDYDADGEKNRIPVNKLFFTKTFKMNIKKNDFIELNLRMFLEYETLDDSHIVDTLIKFFDDDERIYFIKYRNGNFLAYGKYVFLNNNIIYHFEKDTENLKIEIRFEYNGKVFSSGVDKIWHVSRNTIDQWILKHYGGSI